MAYTYGYGPPRDEELAGYGSWLSKAVGAVNKAATAVATVATKAAAPLAKATTAVLRPIERVLPKPIVQAGKMTANMMLAPTRVTVGLVTNTPATLQKAPSMLITQQLTDAMKVGGSLVGGKMETVIDTSANKLQDFSASHPIQTVAALGLGVGAVLAAPAIGAAAMSAGSAIAGSSAGGALLTTALGGAAKQLGGGGGGGGPAAPPTAPPTTAPGSGGSLAAVAAGGGVGFVAGGPIGALIGAGAGYFIGRK
jgi:hypothetical protein